MNERAAIVFGAVLGAAAGSLAGYLFLTEGGRRLRAEWQPRFEDVLRNAAALRDTVERAGVMAGEGWREATDDTRAARPSGAGQHAPF